jgi:hypothetical protein
MSDDEDDLALLSKSFLPTAKSEKVALKKLYISPSELVSQFPVLISNGVI